MLASGGTAYSGSGGGRELKLTLKVQRLEKDRLTGGRVPTLFWVTSSALPAGVDPDTVACDHYVQKYDEFGEGVGRGAHAEARWVYRAPRDAEDYGDVYDARRDPPVIIGRVVRGGVRGEITDLWFGWDVVPGAE